MQNEKSSWSNSAPATLRTVDAMPIGTEPSTTGYDRDTPGRTLRHAAQADRAVVQSLTLPESCSLTERLSSEYDFLGYDLEDGDSISDDELQDAIRVLDQTLQPAEPKQIIQELTKLKSITASRNTSHEELKLTISAIADQLQGYPEDVVVPILQRQASQSKWFPTWYELKQQIDIYCQKRIAARDRLQQELDRRSTRSVGNLIGASIRCE